MRISWLLLIKSTTLLFLSGIMEGTQALLGEQPQRKKVFLVKIGGSSITHKAEREQLNAPALDWFAKNIAEAISPTFLNCKGASAVDILNDDQSKNLAFVIVHGAGSFGHFTAKEYGLRGQSEPPSDDRTLSVLQKRFRMHGVAQTRLSVQKLNQHVVKSLVNCNVNAVGISPGFGIPGLQAHAGKQKQVQKVLETVVRDTVESGLVPVLHGDACLYGSDGGILSGDTIMEILGTASWVDEAVFITDVDGVFSEDPRINTDAQLIRHVFVDPQSGKITTELSASGSSHEHDVTGGLAVSRDCL